LPASAFLAHSFPLAPVRPLKFGKQFATILELAVRLAQADPADRADALLVMIDGPTDWEALKATAGAQRLLIAADVAEQVEGAAAHQLPFVLLNMPEAPVAEKLAQALLEAVADELLAPGASVVAVYSGFEAGKIDSISFIRLHEHLGRLTARDLQRIETQVPLDTLKTVVDLAIEIGREGREGKPVGTMFIIGDTRRVLAQSHPAGYDPVRGYSRKERNLSDPRNRDAIKEIAQLDGAFIVAKDGTIEASCRLVDTAPVELTLSKGLGARHWSAAAISKNTKAVAVVVSESNGSVRIFQDGEVVLRIEPFRRAMKWKDFDLETPPAGE
jgi:DNA integrity scanning protein DisA with diadenylate cyclase activity